jgi:hypothetical protein
VGHAFLLVSTRRGVMGVSVRLPWEPKCIGLLCMADQWAWPPLAVRATSGTRGSEPSTTLGMPRTVPIMVHEQTSPHILGSISSRVPGAGSFTRSSHSL